MRCTADIIIPVYNHLGLTQRCLSNIWVNTWYPYNLIIVDDGSTDGTLDYLKSLAARRPDFTLIYHPQNRGFTAAVNSGLEHSDSEYAVILNNDVTVMDGWLPEMVKVCESYSNTGAVMPTLNHGPARNWSGFNDGHIEMEEIEYLQGVCVLIPHEVRQRVGDFDPDFWMHQSDLDYGIRLLKAGYKIRIARKAFMVHQLNATCKECDWYRDKEYLEENYQKLSQLRAKHGDAWVDRVIGATVC